MALLTKLNHLCDGVLSNYSILIQDAPKEGLNEINGISSIVIFKTDDTKFCMFRPNFAICANKRENRKRGTLL
jgi:hypothetical protein